MEVIGMKYGSERGNEIYRTTCPIVKATMGQHMRHSMDHVERAVQADTDTEIHYDLRRRDTPEEIEWGLMEARIQQVNEQLENMMSNNGALLKVENPVHACFMLSGDSDQEFSIPSMLGRELAFSAHHAIHHLALVKIVATGNVGGLEDTDLPADFGRAPSTVNFDRSDSKKH